MTKKINKEIILIVILPLVFGFLAGIFGYLFAGGASFLGNINISNSDLDRQIVIDQPRSVTVEQDIRLQQIENDLMPVLSNIYLEKKSTNPLNQLYLPSESLGSGIVLTADGWVLTVKSAISNLNSKYQMVGYQAKNYQLSKLNEDKNTGLVFGKVEAANLPVAKIGNSNDIAVGQTVVLASRSRGLVLANVQRIGYEFSLAKEAAISSEDLSRRIFINLGLTAEDNGATIANLKGEIVGIVVDESILPINYFKSALKQVLEGTAIKRPLLGISYIDLAHVDGLLNFGDKGALVYGNPARTSPAFEKVKDGDIVKKINDIELNTKIGLADLLSDYKTGDKIELLIQRGGQEITVEVVLQ